MLGQKLLYMIRYHYEGGGQVRPLSPWFIAPIHTFALHLPQITLKVNTPPRLIWRSSKLFSVLFPSENKTVAGEGSEGAAYQQLEAARVEASNEGTSIRSESLVNFGLAARPGPNTHHMAPKAW